MVQKTLTDITKYPTEHPDYKSYCERLMAIMIGPYTPFQLSLNKIQHSLNQILFGPPGTGKTYNSVNQALAIIDGEIPEDREQATKRFRELIKNGQIVFTTFHQSMCYEDFFEGIKPVEPEIEGESISYSVIDGIFKQLVINAEFEYYKEGELKEKKDQKFILFDDYWNRLIADTESSELAKVTTLSGKFLIIQTVTDKGNIVVKPEQKGALDYTVSYNGTKKLFDAFSDLTKVKNIDKEFRQVIGGSNSTAYWGILNHLRNYNFSNEQILPDFEAKEYNYDQKKDLLLAWNGYINSKIEVKPYILIIDEINRGNVAQIFGELITLLEEDKRLGKTEELRVTLPYSKQKGFGVPANLYIIGTMNTADRAGSGVNIMGKSNVAENTANVAVEVADVKTVEAVAAPVMTVVKNEPEVEQPRKLSLDEKIQRVENLTMLIDRWRTLNESRRKLQTFQIGADSLSSVILLRDAAGNEFKTSNSSVITSVIDEMKRTLDGKVKEVEEQISL